MRHVKLQRSLNTSKLCLSSGIVKGNRLTYWHSLCIIGREVSAGTFVTSCSLCLRDHSFYSVPVFSHSTSGLLHVHFFFFSPETVFPEMCSFSTTPSLRAMCPPPLLNSFTLFPPSLCLVLPDNLFYSRQSSSPLQLSLLILLNCRASFSLPPSLERRGGNISVDVSILHEWWNDISIEYIQTDRL